MSIFSIRGTDRPNPFRPALQYLLSGRVVVQTHSKRSDSPERVDSERGKVAPDVKIHPSSSSMADMAQQSTYFPLENLFQSVAGNEDEEYHARSSPRQSSSRSSNDTPWTRFMLQGGLGSFLFTTSAGWQLYVGLLVLWLGGCSVGLSIVNMLILLTGLYKFPYPITTTFLELLVAHILLVASASLIKASCTQLTDAGLSALVPPSVSLQSARGRGFRDRERSNVIFRLLSSFSGRGVVMAVTNGGLFEFDLNTARQVSPLAAIYAIQTLLSNISFAYAQLPIFLLARICIVPLSLVFSRIFNGTSNSVSLQSAALSATLNLLLAIRRSSIPVNWESIVAGVLSSVFVALYPVQLLRTYKSLMASTPSQNSRRTDSPLYHPREFDKFSGSREESRVSWKLLYYTSLISLVILTPIVILSGELGNISRNCYFLDSLFHWFMVACGGLGTWAIFVGVFLLTKATSPATTSFLFIPSAAFLLPLFSLRMPTYSWVGVVLCWAYCGWFLRVRRREAGNLERLKGRS